MKSVRGGHFNYCPTVVKSPATLMVVIFNVLARVRLLFLLSLWETEKIAFLDPTFLYDISNWE